MEEENSESNQTGGIACLITPAKWQAKGGAKNEQFRKEIVPYMSKITFYPCTQELFDIRNLDGITHFLLKNDTEDKKIIVNKSCRVDGFNNVQIRYIDGQLNNVGYNIVKRIDNFNRIKLEKLEASFFGLKEGETGNYLTGKYAVVKTNEILGYINSITKNIDKINKYKVVMQRVLGNGYYGNDGMTVALNKLYTENPNCITTANYIGLFTSENKYECESFSSYLNTKFCRFMFLIGLVGQGGTDIEVWRHVPDPEAFDHIFTDQELYEKYNLTEEEISIIESVIKERK